MQGTRRTLVAVALVVASMTAGVASANAAGADATAPSCEAPLTELQGLSDADAFSQYSEFAVMRTQMLSRLQTGDCTEAKAAAGSRTVAALSSFRQAYRAAENGDPAAALAAANRSSANVTALRELGREEYALLAGVALDRFYTNLGEQVAANVRESTRTPTRIEQLELAVTAYRRAGAANRFSKLTARVEQLSSEYSADRADVENATANAESFLSSCSVCSSPTTAAKSGLGVLATFQRAKSANARLSTAIELSEKHGLSERTASLRELDARVNDAMYTAAIGASAVIVGYAAAVGALAALVATRLLQWERDLERARTTDIVVPTQGWSE